METVRLTPSALRCVPCGKQRGLARTAMDFRPLVGHSMNLSITIHTRFGANYRVHVTFWEHFLRVVCRRPLPALAALYWHVTRRRVRARNRLRVASIDLPCMYTIWIDENERTDELADSLPAVMAAWPRRPRFTVVVHSTGGAARSAIDYSISSVRQQIYPALEVSEASDGLTHAISRASADFVILLRAGDALSRTALFRYAEAIQGNADATVLYGDQDHLDRTGRRVRPWFKPQWNDELFLSLDYISAAAAIQRGLAKEVAQSDNASDLTSLLLQVTAAAKSIIHVPHITVHVAQETEDPTRVEAISKHLAAKGASCVPGPHGTVKVQWPLPDQLPPVSLIIPTRDKVDVLKPCVESLLQTDYPNLEIIIVDNDSVEKRTADFFGEISQHRNIRVIADRRPFNYSAINNFAAAHAAGTYLCLLNNDTEVVQADWLTQLMRYAVRPNIGAVGPMLLYDDGTIQHAGVVIGIGEAAGHAHRYLPADQPGYFRAPHAAQFVSAVTGACLVVEKAKFEQVGGLDEQNLAVAFNDVDLCLKLEVAGYRNVYVPHAVLIHHESKSRGNDFAPGQVERYRRELKVLQERWGTRTYNDPLHNPNLDRSSETYAFRL